MEDEEEGKDEDEKLEISREVSAMAAYLACPAKQLWGYRTYINEESPFSVQQSIKGEQFERVLVVLDDDEGTHSQFSYNKYFGITPPSKTDLENIASGKETSVERTRRLFYVCCTRAVQDLMVVFFATDVAAALGKIRATNIFTASDIHTHDDLNHMGEEE